MIREEEAFERRKARKGKRRRESGCPKKTVWPVWTATILLATALAGCGAARPSKYYQLTLPGDQAAAQGADPVPATLLLGPLSASHLYREDRIVYSSPGEQMGMYEYQRWAEPPTEMIQEVLLRELQTSSHYKAVYVERSNAGGDFLIRGRLYDFKEISGTAMLAKVTFELEMRDLKSGSTVWTHYYTHDEPVSGRDVSAVVAALNRNVQAALKEMLASLNQYFAGHPFK
ncbi:MAG: hypothetical protein DMG40_20590 [Acidobacteria bacterium]|nr:MAG: hypothetical protein DMG40_20590 [Acidobacteriota bacterium]